MAQYMIPGAYFVGAGTRQHMLPVGGYVLDATTSGAAVALSASAQAVASAIAGLSVVAGGQPVALAAAGVAQASASAQMLKGVRLAAAGVAVAGGGAIMAHAVPLQASAVAAATSGGSLAIGITLSASALAQASASAGMARAARLSAAAAAAATGAASLGTQGTAGWTPAELFKSGEVGAWYDPSDLATLFQDAEGTAPVTAAGQPVGLILDKSKGLVLGGSESVTGWQNGGFSTFTPNGSSITLASAAYAGASATLTGTRVSGRTYRVEVSVTAISGTIRIGIGDAGNLLSNAAFVNTVGSKVFYFQSAITTAAGLNFEASSGGSIAATVLSVQELPGNHAKQATAALKPLYQSDAPRLVFDGGDDVQPVAFPSSLGSSCTIAQSVPGDGASTMTGQTVGVSYTINQTHSGLVIVNRALTGEEQTQLTNYLYSKAGAVVKELSAQAGAQSAGGGSLSVLVRLSSHAVSQALSSAGLSHAVPLGGSAAAQASASASLGAAKRLAGSGAAQADASASLGATKRLAASGAAVAAGGASLLVSVPMSAAALAQATSAGSLQLSLRLDSSALAQADSSAAVEVSVALSANGEVVADGAGELEVVGPAGGLAPGWSAAASSRRFIGSSIDRSFGARAGGRAFNCAALARHFEAVARGRNWKV